jgi:phenylpropionate dioxygenase-like ring-hydroxylating dioxygenase large terminal subunit
MILENSSANWVVIVHSEDVGVEAARSCVVQSRRVVVWRDAAGGAHVWDDHCPHRGEALSSGTVSGGLLTCPVHGWRFDVSGERVRISNPSTAGRRVSCAIVYPVAEQGGLILAQLNRPGESTSDGSQEAF